MILREQPANMKRLQRTSEKRLRFEANHLIFGIRLAPEVTHGYDALSKMLHRCCYGWDGMALIANVPTRIRDFRPFGIGVLLGVALVTLVFLAAL
jgi:hypothetical protein